jgi:hypothetical protein
MFPANLVGHLLGAENLSCSKVVFAGDLACWMPAVDACLVVESATLSAEGVPHSAAHSMRDARSKMLAYVVASGAGRPNYHRTALQGEAAGQHGGHARHACRSRAETTALLLFERMRVTFSRRKINATIASTLSSCFG